MCSLVSALLIVAASAQDVMEGLDIIPDGWVNISSHGRALTPSLGCQRCCSSNPSERDCSQGYNGMAGVCCAGPGSGFIGCCPLRSSCVQCRSSWRCTNSMSVSLASRCSICGAANDKPDACRFVGGMRFGHYSGSHSSPIVSMIILGLLIVSCAACFYTQQQGAYVVGQPGVVVQGQPGVMMQGGYYGGGYGGGAGVASGAAAGFVGGMLVGEMMDSGGGYGGGYGGGGYGGGDFGGGGGDAGFAADE